MKANFSVSKKEKQGILESHNFLKKVLFEKRNIVMINEDDAQEQTFLQKAKKVCKIVQNGNLIKTKSGRNAIKVNSSSVDDPNGNYKSGDMILFYASPYRDGYEGLSMTPGQTNTNPKFVWKCAEMLVAQTTADVQTVQGAGWVSERDPKLSEKVDMRDNRFDTFVDNNGNKYYKTKGGPNVVAAVTGKEQQVEDYISNTLAFGTKGTDWGYETKFGSNWMEVPLPEVEKVYGQKVTIYADPASVKQSKTERGKLLRSSTAAYSRSPEECIQFARDMYDYFTASPDVPTNDPNVLTFKKELKGCKLKYCGTTDKLCAKTQKRGLFRGNRLGETFGEIIDFFSGDAPITMNGVENDILSRRSAFYLE